MKITSGLARSLNRKLAGKGRVVIKNPKSQGMYILLDIATGKRTLMSENETIRLAREVGAVEEQN